LAELSLMQADLRYLKEGLNTDIFVWVVAQGGIDFLRLLDFPLFQESFCQKQAFAGSEQPRPGGG
jgi:hypothetical protein